MYTPNKKAAPKRQPFFFAFKSRIFTTALFSDLLVCSMIKHAISALLLLLLFSLNTQAQKPVYHPCFIMDSVSVKLDFIRYNAARIFRNDTIECRKQLMNKIAEGYNTTQEPKYLETLSAIRMNQSAKTEDLYTDIIRKLCEHDFTNFVKALYQARGRLEALEKELVITLNMIVDGRPYKLRYMGLLNVEISMAKDSKDTARLAYLEKLKKRIEEDRH